MGKAARIRASRADGQQQRALQHAKEEAEQRATACRKELVALLERFDCSIVVQGQWEQSIAAGSPRQDQVGIVVRANVKLPTGGRT